MVATQLLAPLFPSKRWTEAKLRLISKQIVERATPFRWPQRLRNISKHHMVMAPLAVTRVTVLLVGGHWEEAMERGSPEGAARCAAGFM
jgi:hypothetical protein